jgi:toxin YoeB
MKLSWNQNGCDDYLYWQKTDKKILEKINELIKDTMR